MFGEVERVPGAGKGGHRVAPAQHGDPMQVVELGECVVQEKGPELVLCEPCKRRRLLQCGEGRVLGDKHGDANLGVVLLLLESLDDVGLLQVAEEGEECAVCSEEVGEVNNMVHWRSRTLGLVSSCW